MTKPQRKQPHRIANSFTIEEVKLAHFIFTQMSRGANPSAVATRNKAFAGLYAKFLRMQNKLDTEALEAAKRSA